MVLLIRAIESIALPLCQTVSMVWYTIHPQACETKWRVLSWRINRVSFVPCHRSANAVTHVSGRKGNRRADRFLPLLYSTESLPIPCTRMLSKVFCSAVVPALSFCSQRTLTPIATSVSCRHIVSGRQPVSRPPPVTSRSRNNLYNLCILIKPAKLRKKNDIRKRQIHKETGCLTTKSDSRFQCTYDIWAAAIDLLLIMNYECPRYRVDSPPIVLSVLFVLLVSLWRTMNKIANFEDEINRRITQLRK